MSRKNRTIFRITAIALSVLGILMYLNFLFIPTLSGYAFWVNVIAFGILFASSR